MIFFKTFISLSIFALFSCTVPQARTATTRASFDHKNLTQEMLNETVWCGKLTTTITNNPAREVFMAVYFLGNKAGVARGRTHEEAVGTAVYKALNYQGNYQISGSAITVLNFWDGGYGLGRVSAKIHFNNNNEAMISMYYKDTATTGSIAYEVQQALKSDGYVD